MGRVIYRSHHKNFMGIKQQSVSMPMSSAGIVGFSQDMKLKTLELEPKNIIITIVTLVILVKIAHLMVLYGVL